MAAGKDPCAGARLLDLAQFQSIMKDQEPYMELWQERRKQETAASAVAG